MTAAPSFRVALESFGKDRCDVSAWVSGLGPVAVALLGREGQRTSNS